MSLLERDPKSPQAWLGDLPVSSRYTYGLAAERFFRAIKEDGHIMGTRCPDCDHTYVPAALFCERCLKELDEWLDMGTTGEVITFTLLYENYDGSRRETPETIAFVRFGDGGLVHKIGELGENELTIGMKVETVFKPKAEREGSILDITHFRPL